MPEQIYAGRAALHMWEEPCISGEEGSGAVFFSGCSMHCVFCQNQEISAEGRGEPITVEELADTFLHLQEQKANNINLVTAGHYLPSVAEAIRLAKAKGLTIPIVYNSSGYEKTEMLRQLDGLVDIYLPDLKYSSSELAKRYSHASDYPEIAKAAIEEMVRQVGQPVFDERGIMQKGVIVRHLMLPGQYMDSRRVIRYLHETYQNRIYISIMNQYTPMRYFEKYPELNRKIRKKEYEKLLDYALSIGVEQAFYQEGETAKESFIPEFDGTGLKKEHSNLKK
jgi:putative pyruvate formate lyase activating enzyme